MNRLWLLLLLIAAGAFGGVLTALGLPLAVAGTLSFVVIGAIAIWIGPKTVMGSRLPGVMILLLGSVFPIHWAVKAFPQYNTVVVAIVTIVIELVTLLAFFVVRHLILVSARGSAIRRLAARNGWQYQKGSELEIIGWRTPTKIDGVPAGGGRVEAHNVVSGQIDGVDIRIFDVPHKADTQTVWQMRLPISVPYLSSAFGHYLAGKESGRGTMLSMADAFFGSEVPPMTGTLLSPHNDNPANYTDDLDFATAVMTKQVRQMALVDGSPMWWMEGDYLYAWIKWGDVDTDAAKQFASYADHLAKLRGAIPWHELARRVRS